MALSVTAPIGEALESTKKILFRPFDAGKWFTLGFCAFQRRFSMADKVDGMHGEAS